VENDVMSTGQHYCYMKTSTDNTLEYFTECPKARSVHTQQYN